MDSLHYLLMKSHACFSRQVVSRAQRELGLSPGQPKVLDSLMDHEGCDQKTLAAHCEIEQATLGSILSRMEEKGLIQRQRQPGNRRSLFVYLTPEGREAAQTMREIFRQEEEHAARTLTPAQREELRSLLQQFCQGLTPEEPEVEGV